MSLLLSFSLITAVLHCLDAQVIISDVSDGPESSGRMKRQDSPSDGSSWVLADQASGDCEAACSRVNKKCDEAMAKKAASNPNGEDFEGIGCTERNQWYFGQGFSQCTDKSCGSRLHQCSITPYWPGCKTNGFFNNDHQDQSRICPCGALCEESYTAITTSNSQGDDVTRMLQAHK